MKVDLQDRVCAFVRDIISARTHEDINISARPDREQRSGQAVEELWESSTRCYAIEHTRIEAFDGQIANQSRIERLLIPVKIAIASGLPGYFTLAIRADDLAAARFDEESVQMEIARLIIKAAGSMTIGQTVTLASRTLPFTLELHLRHNERSNLILYTDINGNPEELRLQRIRRAFDAKCPKLKAWSADYGRTSILALESNDLQLSNAFSIYEAAQRALNERNDQPDIVVLVETYITPMNAWMLKEGSEYGNDVPGYRRGYLYTEGSVGRWRSDSGKRPVAATPRERGEACRFSQSRSPVSRSTIFKNW